MPKVTKSIAPRDGVQWEAFRWALTEQETQGEKDPYKAKGAIVKGDRAYGRYQVMGDHVPDWTAEYWGKRLTPDEFLASPAAQDAVVNGRLGGYFTKYGPRGAAAAWYSGDHTLDMSTRPQPSGPSIKSYVDSVMARVKKWTGQESGGTSDAGYKWPHEYLTPDPNEESSGPSVTDALGAIVGGVQATGKLADQLMKLALPTSLTRLGAAIAGIAFIIAGIRQLSREVITL